MEQPILSIQQATKVYGGGFLSSSKSFVALDHFSLDIFANQAKIIAIAGESGSGKTTLANLILGFTSCTEGKVLYKDVDLATMTRQQRIKYRKEVQAVFQDPYEVYNPFYRVSHIMNMVVRHFDLAQNKTVAAEMIENALKVVGLRSEEILEKYPHQLSGGQRQRVMVARAYMLRPRLIVADEPVSAVDASLRAMILDIMFRLRDDLGISFLYITHDLSTAYQISDSMYVLFQGTTVERGNAAEIIENPKHPYVQELIESIPVPDPEVKWNTDISLPSEEVMRMTSSVGCRFYPRCARHMDRCKEAFPEMVQVGNDHQVACYLYQ
jgi:peptide/nickel transport system ATP-binding protein